jgi:hypothetical protein
MTSTEVNSMATKKNSSAKHKSTTSLRETIAIKIRKLDKRMAELRDLFGWGLSDAQTDLSRVCYGDLTGQYEDLIATAVAVLNESPVYEFIAEEFEPLGESFQLRWLCARMYLAGKCSPQRIDMAIFVAANPPLTPDKL